MNPEPEELAESSAALRGGPPATGRPTDEMIASLRRIERLLEQVRQRLDSTVRAERYREFSLARLIGALLQALVVGLLIAALADWAFQGAPVQQLLKLMFAGVLQLGALTAFVVSREKP